MSSEGRLKVVVGGVRGQDAVLRTRMEKSTVQISISSKHVKGKRGLGGSVGCGVWGVGGLGGATSKGVSFGQTVKKSFLQISTDTHILKHPRQFISILKPTRLLQFPNHTRLRLIRRLRRIHKSS